MGITLHRAVAAVDAGPVLETDEIPVAAGASASEVNAALARRGAALLARAVRHVETGALRESVQDEARATWFGWPDESAFRFPTSWTAERAFRFMRGVAEWGRSFWIEAANETLKVESALDFGDAGRARGQGTARRKGGDDRVLLRDAARASFPRLGAQLARLNPKRNRGGGAPANACAQLRPAGVRTEPFVFGRGRSNFRILLPQTRVSQEREWEKCGVGSLTSPVNGNPPALPVPVKEVRARTPAYLRRDPSFSNTNAAPPPPGRDDAYGPAKIAPEVSDRIRAVMSNDTTLTLFGIS